MKKNPAYFFSLSKPKIPSIFPFFQLKKFKKTQPTPPRTHRINGVKSQILKPTFLA